MDVILVDYQDNEIGTAEKHVAHENGGTLHRSFSILLFDNNDMLLVHRRAKGKYHTPGLWTNTCCSHPRPGEAVYAAAQRRMLEELGAQYSCEEVYSFIYRADLDRGMVEHEFDHVFFGRCHDVSPLLINTDEIEEVDWVSVASACSGIMTHPNRYTPWFRIIMIDYLNYIQSWLKNTYKPTIIK